MLAGAVSRDVVTHLMDWTRMNVNNRASEYGGSSMADRVIGWYRVTGTLLWLCVQLCNTINNNHSHVYVYALIYVLPATGVHLQDFYVIS